MRWMPEPTTTSRSVGALPPNDAGYLRLYVAQLRRKLEPVPSAPRHFLNEPGLGYRFEP